MSKYFDIASDLESKIESGYYLPESKLPSEAEMIKTYNASSTTIKHALKILTEQGYIYRRQGDGTYVNDITELRDLDNMVSRQFGGFTEANKDCLIKTEVLDFKIINPEKDIAKKLKLQTSDYIYYIKRLRYRQNIPCVIEHTYMPLNLIPGITPDNASQSIYKYIESQLNYKIKSAQRQVYAKPATDEQKQLLKIEDDVAILEYRQLVFLDTGAPFEYSISQNRGDINVSVSVLNR